VFVTERFSGVVVALAWMMQEPQVWRNLTLAYTRSVPGRRSASHAMRYGVLLSGPPAISKAWRFRPWRRVSKQLDSTTSSGLCQTILKHRERRIKPAALPCFGERRIGMSSRTRLVINLPHWCRRQFTILTCAMLPENHTPGSRQSSLAHRPG
jgi:hypothetical protein